MASSVTAFLKNKSFGPPTVEALLRQFKKDSDLTREDKNFAKQICENLEFTVEAGTVGDTYMEVT